MTAISPMRKIVTAAAAMVLAASCDHAASPQGADAGPQAGSRPNILLIVADDLGYQDLGAFGSEIRTPIIDALAATGLILTNYYTSPMCAPTRAMLLSGTDNHLAGLGAQRTGGPYEGQPGYEGYLNHRIVSIATRMAEADYLTAMSGKWHLGYEDDQRPAARGFKRSFALLDPGASHFADRLSAFPNGIPARYRDDDEAVETLPEDFYSTVYYTDRMIEYVDESVAEGRPFFGYLAYTAPHWPTHALDEDMERVRGRYDEGYDVIRARRFARWKELGFAPADAELPADPIDYVPWDLLTPEEQALSARTMEAYAAMVERLDIEIGRMLAHLEDQGVLDDTLVIFVSDNGAEGTGNDWPRMGDYLAEFDNSLENIGRPGSYRFIGPGWAEAGSASYHLRKTFTAEGGIHVPAIVNAPALGVPSGRSDAHIAVQDLAPTFLELAGASETLVPEGSEGALPITGRSFAGVLRAEPDAARPAREAVAWELHGHRAIRRGDWKATWIEPPFGEGAWTLHNLAEDPGERIDLAAERPDLLAGLVAEWNRYARANGVVLEDDAS